MLDTNDPWELNHYRGRIPVYYGKDLEHTVLGILDGIAVRPEAISLNVLLTELKGTGTLDDRELLIDLLRLIEQDHYLSRNADGRYRFRFPLLQRWWKLSRGLWVPRHTSALTMTHFSNITTGRQISVFLRPKRSSSSPTLSSLILS